MSNCETFRPFATHSYEGIGLFDYYEFLTASRVPEVVDLFERNFNTPRENIEEWMHVDEILRCVERSDDGRPDFVGIVGLVDGRVRGCVLAAREPLYLEKWNIPLIAVDGEFRQGGRGKVLVQSLLLSLRSMGAWYVTTDTNRDHLDGKAVEFWLDCGFEQDGEPQWGYWDGSNAWVVKFKKTLWQTSSGSVDC